jgi:hypothetical protein
MSRTLTVYAGSRRDGRASAKLPWRRLRRCPQRMVPEGGCDRVHQ